MTMYTVCTAVKVTISVIEKEVLLTVNEPLTVALTFKPARADGLLMLLTTDDSTKAIFAAGLRNGRVLVYCSSECQQMTIQ